MDKRRMQIERGWVEELSRDNKPYPHKREICCNLDDFSKKKYRYFIEELEN